MKLTAISTNAIFSRQNAGADTVDDNAVRFGSANTAQCRKAPPVHLTPRQLEVLSLLCEGLPNKLICRRLNISAGTVKVHIGCILKELGVSSRLQAVVSARRCGLDLEPCFSMPEEMPERIRSADSLRPRSSSGLAAAA